MKTFFSNSRPHTGIASHQKGLTLIELMISMTLGLLLLTGLTQIFISNRQTFSATESSGQLEENGRFAMEFLVNAIRKAGYVSDVTNGLTGTIKPFMAPTDCKLTDGWCTQNGINAADSDKIAIQFDATGDTDCNGVALPTAPAPARPIMANVFWVDADKNNNDLPTLYCRGYLVGAVPPQWIPGSTKQPLIPGIETLQVLYGEVTGNGTADVPDHYVSAERVTNWAKIRSVRIAVLAQSGGTGTRPSETRNFAIMDAGLFSFTDKQSRVIYQTTITLENMNNFKSY